MERRSADGRRNRLFHRRHHDRHEHEQNEYERFLFRVRQSALERRRHLSCPAHPHRRATGDSRRGFRPRANLHIIVERFCRPHHRLPSRHSRHQQLLGCRRCLRRFTPGSRHRGQHHRHVATAAGARFDGRVQQRHLAGSVQRADELVLYPPAHGGFSNVDGCLVHNAWRQRRLAFSVEVLRG